MVQGRVQGLSQCPQQGSGAGAASESPEAEAGLYLSGLHSGGVTAARGEKCLPFSAQYR